MADFVDVIKIKNRMCESVENCNDCPVGGNCNIIQGGCGLLLRKYPEQAQEILLKWAEEHPVKTNADKFEEVFGHKVNIDECPFIGTKECHSHKSCFDCPNNNFWEQEHKNQR